jgi:biotin carboxyl carrier protein
MKLKITVHGVAYEVDVEVLDPGDGFAPSSPLPPVHRGEPAGPAPGAPAAVHGDSPGSPGPGAEGTTARTVTSPIAGTVVEVQCRPGEAVTAGKILMVLEAMKMNTSIASPAAGTIRAVPVAAGDTVREGQILVEFA